jgi:hypothetical protein
MKLHWKKLPVVLVAVAALAACDQRAPLSPNAQLASSQAGSLSAQTGNGAPKGQLVFSWNLIGTPGDYEGGCGDGRRIFVERGANHEHILFQDGDRWRIVECDATFGDEAIIQSADLGTLDVYVRILGKPSGRLFVCADTVEDHATGEHLCLLGTIDLHREGGRSRFDIKPDQLFDASLEDIIWSVFTNSDFRIAQFRVYETP